MDCFISKTDRQFENKPSGTLATRWGDADAAELSWRDSDTNVELNIGSLRSYRQRISPVWKNEHGGAE
jgi:hypothetical protein